MDFKHKSVLLKETIEALNIKPDGIYIDGTAGAGGHSLEIAKRLKTGKLISIDRDPDAIIAAKDRLKDYKCVTVVKSDFSKMNEVINDFSIDAVDGILLDLGVSSYQLDKVERGFSYHNEAFLDMRMSKSGVSAYDLVNTLDKNELAKIIYNYGEEKYARSIASAIEKERKITPIKTTTQLVEIIKKSVPSSERFKNKHPARKTFQAIRIAVNDELGQLNEGLENAFSILKPQGRLAVITFHSIEDRIVKKKMADWCVKCTCPPDFPICVCNRKQQAELLFKKPLVASDQELAENKRSRSAKLRVCIKV